MDSILKIASGVFLGELVWGIVLFTFLYILIKRIIHKFTHKLCKSGFDVTVRGRGSLRGVGKTFNIRPSSFSDFAEYSVNSTKHIVDRATSKR